MNAAEQKPVLVMAGGTGGHVFPALAVAELLRRRGERVIWLGTRSGIEARVVPAAGYAIEWLDVFGLRGKGLAKMALAPFALLRAGWQALVVLLRLKPKAVLGMGGFVSGPGGLMARILRIPLILHEQNSVIGLTNRLLCRIANRNYFAFERAALGVPRAQCIGNPVRAEFLALPDPANRLQARIDAPMRLLVIGGSLGAAPLNRILPQALACLDRSQRPIVIHQCGEQHVEACRRHYAEARVDAEIVSFIDDMATAYADADLAICRAGALTVAELGAVGLGALLVPLPHAVDNHQYYNALYLEELQAAQILDETDLAANTLALKLQFFQQNRRLLIDMAVRARAGFRPDAADRLADGILAEVKA